MANDFTAFPDLDDGHIAMLETLGVRRPTVTGEFLYREGDATYDFYVVLSGEVEIITGRDDDEEVLVTHGAGKFLGELNLLSGLRVFVSARVVTAGEVLVIGATELRHIIATQPALSDVILATFIARRAGC